MRPVKLRVRRVTRHWKVKSIREPDGKAKRVKAYTQAWIAVPSGVDVSDLIGRPFTCRRAGNKLTFEPSAAGVTKAEGAAKPLLIPKQPSALH